jgi:hypothetical protein
MPAPPLGSKPAIERRFLIMPRQPAFFGNVKRYSTPYGG